MKVFWWDYIPEKAWLVEPSYNDTLDKHLPVIEDCIHEGVAQPLWEEFHEWLSDAQMEAAACEADEVLSEMAHDGIVQVSDEVVEAITQEIIERDHSDPIRTLLNATWCSVSAPLLDGRYFELFDAEEAEVVEAAGSVCKALNIPVAEFGKIKDLLACCPYNGAELRIVWREDYIFRLIEAEDTLKLRFEGPITLATWCADGSGDLVTVETAGFTVEVERKDLRVDDPYGKTEIPFTNYWGLVRDWVDGRAPTIG